MSGSKVALFRAASLQNRQTAWLGRPTIALGLPVTLATLISLVLAGALTALVAFGSYTRRVDLDGIMLPQAGIASVAAPETGAIRALAVKEGDDVREGDLLYTIDVDTGIKEGGAQQAVISALMVQRHMLAETIERKQTMANNTQQQLTQTIANLEAQLKQLGQEIGMQESFEQRLRTEYQQYLSAFNRHMIPAAVMDARQQSWMAAQSSLQQLMSSKLRLQAELINAKYQASTNPNTAKNEIDDLKGKISTIDQSIATSEAHRAIEVRAPRAGVVTAIAAQPGQAVSRGARLLTIVPSEGTMVGQLLAPSAAVGFIHPGERVLLRYAGFPYQKFGQHRGVVQDVSRAALSGDEVRQWPAGSAPTQSGEYYEITVLPDNQTVAAFGGQARIPANMQVNAYIMLDKRPLYQWILEPIYSVRRAWRN